jgi:hypothetical protein
MVAGKQDSEGLSEQATVVYKLLHEQVAFLKKQQWTITNYIALIYAAIFGVTKELQSTSFPSTLKCILIAAAIVACVYGPTALTKVQVDLGEARERLDKTDREIFGDKEYRELGLRQETHPFWRGMFFTGALMLVLVIGAVIVVSYLTAI